MYGQIKQIVKESIEEINAKILIGSISSIEPFKVSIEQRLILPQEVFIFPEYLERSLRLNDKLIIVNLGEEYLIFDKVGDINNAIITE